QVEGRADVDVAPKGSQRAALVVRDNFRHRDDIERAYLKAIESAREEIVLANAYFFPGIRFRRALLRAAGRGVRVVLLLQGRVEYALLHYASHALYGTLLEAGVEIYEYHRSFLHAKVAVVDGHWATVGSSNIDPFSLSLAREANVVVEDRGFAAELHHSLRAAMKKGARVVAKTRWFRQPVWKRIPIWLAYALVRFITGMVGYGGKF
ncbi:MAG: phospholipase D-like domain-containing protein, partial [Burkholderiales bacterium]